MYRKPVPPDAFPDMPCFSEPGEHLCLMIERSIQGGVLPEASIKPVYDDDGVDVVDPSCDITIDPFLYAEYAQADFSRNVARSMTEAANNVVPLSEGAPDPVNSAESGAPSAPAASASE